MHKYFWNQWPLALRLTITITLAVVLVVVFISAVTIRRERQTFQGELEQQAKLLLDTLAAASADSLYFLEADFLSDLMRDLGEFQVVTFGRIYDSEGRVVADAINFNSRFTITPDIFGLELLAGDEVVFQWSEDQLLAGKAVIVGNQRIGAVSVGLPTAPLAAKIETVRTQGVIVAAAAATVGLLLALFISRSITEPIQHLIEATDKVAEGHLAQQVIIQGNDELAHLGSRFNQMTNRLEQTLAQMEDEIEERKRQVAELDAFAHTVAHDLKNPLTLITGFADLLRTNYAKMALPDRELALHRIEKSAYRAVNIIEELLLLASVRKQDVMLAPVDMGVVVEQVLDRLAFMTEEHNATIRLPRNWPVVMGYGPWIEEVWANYISNGIKYGGKPPCLELGATIQTNGMIRFWVRDDGPGLPAEKLAVLFTEFVRLSELQIEGHGLGLSIVQRIMSKLGGRVGVESELGKGSEFYFVLPIAD
ncbi:MAG: HAMP domain-containing protein [Chloroflexi bacterium]|nr:HAMP domain-containing protein [Chloroflexota bacterium]MBP8057538.1 HAMP domain-containing protein [Chloroflexota bacterium]